MSKEKINSSGNWGETTSWEVFENNELPPRELCSSVFCVPITPNGKVYIMRDEGRGWGLIGGHIKQN